MLTPREATSRRYKSVDEFLKTTICPKPSAADVRAKQRRSPCSRDGNTETLPQLQFADECHMPWKTGLPCERRCCAAGSGVGIIAFLWVTSSAQPLIITARLPASAAHRDTADMTSSEELPYGPPAYTQDELPGAILCLFKYVLSTTGVSKNRVRVSSIWIRTEDA